MGFNNVTDIHKKLLHLTNHFKKPISVSMGGFYIMFEKGTQFPNMKCIVKFHYALKTLSWHEQQLEDDTVIDDITLDGLTKVTKLGDDIMFMEAWLGGNGYEYQADRRGTNTR